MPPRKKKGDGYGPASMYLVVPGIMIAAPLIGYFVGSWADKKFGTGPYLLIVGLLFGFVAAGREIYKLVQKVQAMEDEEGDDR